jgi:hypothetical protein
VPVPTTAHADRWYSLDGQAVTGREARLLEAFVAAVPELRTYNLADVYRVLVAARAVLQAQADADGPGDGLPAGAGRPDPCGPTLRPAK